MGPFCLGNAGSGTVLPESPDQWQNAEVEAGGPAGVITSNRPEDMLSNLTFPTWKQGSSENGGGNFTPGSKNLH